MLEDRRSPAAEFYFNGTCLVRAVCRANFKKPRFSLGTYGARLADETRGTSAIAKPRFRNKPLLFASTEEAVVYLELMGFSVEDDGIGCNGLAMATHRTLFDIDWLCDNGFTCAAPTREPCAS